MSRYRFRQLVDALHFADDDSAAPPTSPAFDKIYKVRPVVDALNEAWVSLVTPGWAVSIDEMMIAFRGRSYLRQYMPAKIVKWGFKLWALCDAVSGFCLKFDVYGGERPGEAPTKKLGQSVVLELAQVVPRGTTIFADRYFSTVELIAKLKEEEIDYVGTIKENAVCYPGDLLRLPCHDSYKVRCQLLRNFYN
jgi:hypothetical protein